MRSFILENNILRDIKVEEIELNMNKYYWIIATPTELEEIYSDFNIKYETVEECSSKRHDTKIEIYDDHTFCIFNEIEVSKGQVKIEELNVYYSSSYIICVSKEPSKVVENILKQFENKSNNLLLNSTNPCNKILYIILDGLFQSYFDGIIELEKKVSIFEEEVLKNKLKFFLNQFIDIRKQLLRIVRYITPIVYLIDIIKLNENKLIDDTMMRYFDNIEIKFNKLDSNIVSLRESVTYLREAYEAEVANQTNRIMKIFTFVSVIFLPLTLLTGIFGMNFDNIPLTQNPTGFFQLIGLMLVTVVILIILFRKKSWI